MVHSCSEKSKLKHKIYSMKRKIIDALIYLFGGLTVQYLLTFSRGLPSHYKLIVLMISLFAVGYIIRELRPKFIPNRLLFLIGLLGTEAIGIFTHLNDPHLFLMELAAGFPAYILGYYIDTLNIKLKLGLTVLLITFVLYLAYIVYPPLLYAQYQKLYANYQKRDAAPEFQFIDKDSNIISSSTLKNKIVLLDYWFIGCGPCKTKMKELSYLAEYYKNDTSIVILAIDRGSGSDTFNNFQKEIKKFPDNITFAYDAYGKNAQEMSIEAYPTEFIIDKNWKIASSLLGFGVSIASIYKKETIAKINELKREK